MQFRAGLIAIALTLVLAPAAMSASRSAIVRVVDVGSGAHEVWVFIPEGKPDCLLTFVHDDGDISPARYTSWLDYTALNDHCAIVFPRYQARAHSTPAANVAGLRAGIAAGVAFIRANSTADPATAPQVAAGFGSGATLAIALAVNARQWGLSAPSALDVVFPVITDHAPLPGAKVGARIHALIQFGDHDTPAARSSAPALRRYFAARRAGLTQIRMVRSSAAFTADHDAPLRVDTPSENAFWGPLDNLIGLVT
jgi:hypothetical protein